MFGMLRRLKPSKWRALPGCVRELGATGGQIRIVTGAAPTGADLLVVFSPEGRQVGSGWGPTVLRELEECAENHQAQREAFFSSRLAIRFDPKCGELNIKDER